MDRDKGELILHFTEKLESLTTRARYLFLLYSLFYISIITIIFAASVAISVFSYLESNKTDTSLTYSIVVAILGVLITAFNGALTSLDLNVKRNRYLIKYEYLLTIRDKMYVTDLHGLTSSELLKLFTYYLEKLNKFDNHSIFQKGSDRNETRRLQYNVVQSNPYVYNMNNNVDQINRYLSIFETRRKRAVRSAYFYFVVYYLMTVPIFVMSIAISILAILKINIDSTDTGEFSVIIGILGVAINAIHNIMNWGEFSNKRDNFLLQRDESTRTIEKIMYSDLRNRSPIEIKRTLAHYYEKLLAVSKYRPLSLLFLGSGGHATPLHQGDALSPYTPSR